jgi:hypothetical protein
VTEIAWSRQAGSLHLKAASARFAWLCAPRTSLGNHKAPVAQRNMHDIRFGKGASASQVKKISKRVLP